MHSFYGGELLKKKKVNIPELLEIQFNHNFINNIVCYSISNNIKELKGYLNV